MEEGDNPKHTKKRKSLKRKWRPVAIEGASFTGEEMEGFVSLEELVDYDVNDIFGLNTGEDGGQEKTTKKKKKKKKAKKKKEVKSEQVEEAGDEDKEENPEEQTQKEESSTSKQAEDTNVEDDEDLDMSNWDGLGVPPLVISALKDLKFDGPTPIQSLAIPAATLYKKDVVGAAETGSGKTLAFGIPLLERLLSIREKVQKENGNKEISETSSSDKTDTDKMDCTAESDSSKRTQDTNEQTVSKTSKKKRKKKLKKNIENNMETEAADKMDCGDSAGEEKAKVSVERTLSDNPLLGLILTPTRELALQVKNHLQAAAKHTGIKIAAIVGGMAPQKQLRLLHQHPEVIVATPGRLWELISEGEDHVSRLNLVKVLVLDEADRMVEEGHFAELTSILELLDKKSDDEEPSLYDDSSPRQTFVFSATLTLSKEEPKKKNFKKKQKAEKHGLEHLMDKVKFNGKPKIIDLTSKQATAQSLQEARITCNTEDKDVYLYYFLLKYTGRTLVFVNTIDSLRRLASILALLGLSPLPLHASMQQRQRLKNLDRFRSKSDGLLLATDVAARGLDIPNVQHVIHYQVPSNPETYVHRSGRTARISKEGVSVVIIGPDDLKSYKTIVKTLNRDEDLPVFPVEVSYLSAVRKRVSVARQVDKEENKIKKLKSSNNWFINNAKAMDIELDEDLLEDVGDLKQKQSQDRRLQQLKGNLAELLKTPIVPMGFSGKYPTQSGKLVLPGISGAGLSGESEATATEVVKRKRKKAK